MSCPSILEILKDRVVLLDGAMGTALMKQGLETGTPGELWNVENPGAVKNVHAAYLAAGSDVVQTNTFGGTTFRLESHGLAGRMEEIVQAAARIARESGFVERVYWWQLINPGYGLVDHRGGMLRKMPSYHAFRALLRN